MSVYLDASVLVALFTDDAFTERADRVLRASEQVLVVSDFAAAEFASAVARRVRIGELTVDEARTAFANFDTWLAGRTQREETQPGDVSMAQSFLRRLDLPLRTPDALNIAIAQRLDLLLMTFDRRMLASARALGNATGPV